MKVIFERYTNDYLMNQSSMIIYAVQNKKPIDYNVFQTKSIDEMAKRMIEKSKVSINELCFESSISFITIGLAISAIIASITITARSSINVNPFFISSPILIITFTKV